MCVCVCVCMCVCVCVCVEWLTKILVRFQLKTAIETVGVAQNRIFWLSKTFWYSL